MKSSPVMAVLCALALAGCGSDTPEQPASSDSAPAAVYGGSSQQAAPQQPSAPAAPQKQATQKDSQKSGQKSGQKSNTGKPIGSKTLAYPEDLQMIMLSYRLRGETPPYQKWAEDAQDVRRANEFTRAQALNDEMQRLRDAYDSTADVGFIQLRTSSQFSQYDANQGGYYLTAFSPGTTYTFDAYREKAALQLTNSGDAYFWPLDPQRAQDILQQNLNSRGVTIDATLALTGIERRSTGPMLTAQILEYSVVSTRYGHEGQLDRRNLQ